MLMNRRLRPWIWHQHYFALVANRRVMELMRRKLRTLDVERPCILDIGCGQKPFQLLFPGSCYIGADFSLAEASPDVVADNGSLPFADRSFDACIASETLEHTSNYEVAIEELVRLTKTGGYIFISVPFVHPMHHHPYDFQRITEYRFIQLFKDHEIVELRASNTIFTTWIVALEYALAGIAQLLPFPSQLMAFSSTLLNSFAFIVETVVNAAVNLFVHLPTTSVEKLRARIKHPRSIEGVVTSMPCGYAILIRVK